MDNFQGSPEEAEQMNDYQPLHSGSNGDVVNDDDLDSALEVDDGGSRKPSRVLVDAIAQSTGRDALAPADEEGPETEPESDESDEAGSETGGADEEADQDAEGEEAGEQDTDEAEDPEEESSESENGLPENVTQQIHDAFPDREFESSEDYEEALNELTQLPEQLNQLRESNKRVKELFENSSEFLELAKAMDDGRGFLEALAYTVGPDFEQTMEELKEKDPEEFKKVIRAQVEKEKELEEQQKKQKAKREQFEQNEEESVENLEQFKKDNGLDDKEFEQVTGQIQTIFDSLISGKIPMDFVELIYKGLNRDKDVAAAEKNAKTQAKNEKIRQKRTKKKGSGLPDTKGGGSPRSATSKASRGKKALVGIVGNSKSTFE